MLIVFAKLIAWTLSCFPPYSDSELLSHHTRPFALSDPLDNRRVNLTRPPPHSNPSTPRPPSPHHSSPNGINAPLGSKKLAPPSPRHSCPNTPLSSKKPAVLPKPQHLQTGADEYVDPRVFQEDYEKSVEVSYVLNSISIVCLVWS